MYTYTYHACIQPRWLHPHTYTQPTNSCTYIHIYVYTYSHIHVHPFTPCTCAYIHTCSIPTYAYNIRTHTCMHTHKYIHICIHAFESSAVTRPIFPGSALCRLWLGSRLRSGAPTRPTPFQQQLWRESEVSVLKPLSLRLDPGGFRNPPLLTVSCCSVSLAYFSCNISWYSIVWSALLHVWLYERYLWTGHPEKRQGGGLYQPCDGEARAASRN